MLAPGFTIQVERFDVRRPLAQGEAPHLLMKRDLGDDGSRVKMSAAQLTTGEDWYVLHEKLPGVPNQPRWSINKGNTHVVIPLFDYLLPQDCPEILVHFGAQTGALASMLASRLAQDKFLTKMLLAVGNVFQRSDGHAGFQVWAGFAACVENRGG